MSLNALVLTSTDNLSREQWLQARRKGIGGSDVAKIALPNYRWGSPMSIWLEKTGQLPPEEVTSEAAELGTELEEFVAWKFTQRTGKRVRRKNAILQHPEHPWMLANVDRLVVGEDEGLECKTASEYLKNEWIDDELPTAYFLQCQHYMAVTGYKAWWIAVLIGGNKFRYKRIERDEMVIDHIIRIESDFWNNHVVPGIPPMMDGSDASTNVLNVLYPDSNGQAIELAPDSIQLVKDLDEAKEELKAADLKVTEIENKLKQMLGDNEMGWVGDRKITWKSVTSNRFDSTTFKKDHPDLYTKYAKQSESRRFTVK